MSKILVLYVFHEINDRVQSFIKNCIFDDLNIDFIMISNNKDNVFEVPSYVKKMYRDNIGYDFGGWSDALLTDNLYMNYDKFIFVNSSVIGPFISDKKQWPYIYLNGLQGNIKIFGSSINSTCDPTVLSHVQSYIFAIEKNTLEYLIKCEIFSITNYAQTFHDAIYKKEILMSRKIIENGWNIGSLLNCYKDVDFTFSTKQVSDYNIRWDNDLMYNCYYNHIWNEREIVFVKGNRDYIVSSQII